jgi:replicative DNA helicase
LLESVDGLSYIVSLDDGLPHITNLGSYVQIIKDKALLRRIAVSAQSMMNRALMAEETPEQILNSLGQTIIDLSPADEKRGFVSAVELVDREGINELLEPRRENGIQLPWSSLNGVLCGFQEEQLILLAAHTSVGKTAAATQVVVGAARQGIGVAVFSLEMSTKSLFRRMAYQISRVDAERHRHNKLTGEDRERLRAAAAELYEMPIYWNDTASCTVPAIHAELRKLRMRAKVGLVVVDFLQIVRGTGRVESRNNEVGANSRGLKLAAKEFGIPFLVLSQLSRKSDAENRPPKLSDLRDSGEIEENSDVVWFIHRPTSDPMNPVKLSEFIVAKQREGPRDVSLPMVFMSQCQRFEVATGEGE